MSYENPWKYNDEIIDKIMLLIFQAKYSKLIVKSDAEFIDKCLSIIQKN